VRWRAEVLSSDETTETFKVKIIERGLVIPNVRADQLAKRSQLAV